MDKAIFEKVMEIIDINHRVIKLVTTEAKGDYFVSKPTYHTTNKNSDNLLATKIKITKILINKPV